MSAIVFLGPTLSSDAARALVDAEIRSPAAQGDVYRAARDGPKAIGIVDGYFDGVPSVWHKEILWAMSEGIAVFGSASIGALRAAELDSFGMRGVGRIYEAYRDGRIEDDDEVAVMHAPAELGFRPLSEPMVSIRATLERAVAEGVVTDASAASLADTAKALHYRERSWTNILAAAGEPEPARGSFSAWLERSRVDAKREDAVAMLQAMAAFLKAGGPAPAANYTFEHTNVWQALTERVAEEVEEGDAAGVLDELRLDPDRFATLRERAVLRRLARDRAAGASLKRTDLVATMARHRRRHGLQRRPNLEAWLTANALTSGEYEALLTGSLLVEAGTALPAGALEREIQAELKWTGAYAPLLERARKKGWRLANRDSAHAASGARPQRPGLLIWYFEQCLGREIPADLDEYARSLGLDGREALYSLLEREYRFRIIEDHSHSETLGN